MGIISSTIKRSSQAGMMTKTGTRRGLPFPLQNPRGTQDTLLCRGKAAASNKHSFPSCLSLVKALPANKCSFLSTRQMEPPALNKVTGYVTGGWLMAGLAENLCVKGQEHQFPLHCCCALIWFSGTRGWWGLLLEEKQLLCALQSE